MHDYCETENYPNFYSSSKSFTDLYKQYMYGYAHVSGRQISQALEFKDKNGCFCFDFFKNYLYKGRGNCLLTRELIKV